MENYVLSCGFSEKEIGLMEGVLPAEDELRHADDVTNMIVISALCYIVSGENLDGNERIFRIGIDSPSEIVTVYDCRKTTGR